MCSCGSRAGICARSERQRSLMRIAVKITALSVLSLSLLAVAAAQSAPDTFPPFEQWKTAVLAGDAPALKALYSTDPAAQMRIKTVMHEADADTSFWLPQAAH